MKALFSKFMIAPALAMAVAVTGCNSDVSSPLAPSAPTLAVPKAKVAAPAAAALSSASANSDVEFRGRVQSVTPPTLRVSGVTIRTDVDTEIERRGRRIALGDLNPGEIVEVEGRLLSDGIVLAREIKSTDDDEVEFDGRVESVTPPTLRVSGTTILTDGSTRITRDGRPITLADIRVGERADVDGVLLEDGGVLARSIQVDEDDVEFTGRIESISAPDLRVAGVTVHTGPDTRISRDGRPITLGDLRVGDIVEVEGTLLPDGSVRAREIEVEDDEDVEFDGRIDSISAPNLLVGGVTVRTDGGTQIRRGCLRIGLGDLRVGERVEVEGTLQPDGSVLARRITARGDDGCDDEDDDDDDDDDDEGDDDDDDDDDEGDDDDGDDGDDDD